MKPALNKKLKEYNSQKKNKASKEKEQTDGWPEGVDDLDVDGGKDGFLKEVE
ncbi:hypothetical protein RJ035_008259, partial [Blastomyces gilchristii]